VSIREGLASGEINGGYSSAVPILSHPGNPEPSVQSTPLSRHSPLYMLISNIFSDDQ
jgi:hypothetical protein